MAIVEVKVPQLSESVAEATMLQWKKKVGDSVAADEILIEIETDKVVLEVPAPSAGVLSEILVGDGGTVLLSNSLHALTPTAKWLPLRLPPLLHLHLQRQLHLLLRLPHKAPAWLAWPCPLLPS